MDIATDSAGATERKNIDLVETFNYLIGLHVKSIESDIARGYVRIEGTLPTGERTLILWRDCDKIGYEELNKYANRFDLYAKKTRSTLSTSMAIITYLPPLPLMKKTARLFVA